ncbi:MAG: hypothetical protein BWY47_01896 [Bacteroidetes bacterium ADurb.Bin302]|nr:MAG: hypothetical protein BWY47_01896 [Bacteroidetes bacterium ADurb.Bin302]
MQYTTSHTGLLPKENVISTVKRNFKKIDSLKEYYFYRKEYKGVNYVFFYRKWKTHSFKTRLTFSTSIDRVIKIIDDGELFVCLNEIKPHWEFNSSKEFWDNIDAFESLYNQEYLFFLRSKKT